MTMAMASWARFPHPDAFAFTEASLRKKWSKLHAGDQEPWPKDPAVLAAWVLFHGGEYQQAYTAGLRAGPAGFTVANKAACVYAHYLEPKEKTKQDLFLEVAARAAQQVKDEPENANAYYLQGYALGRYSQGISVAKALAQGVGGKVKSALETAIHLQPLHADAHIALGAFHAEVIDKVGALIGNMTYGAKKDSSLQMFQRGLELKPESPIALMEYAHGLIMLDGEKKMAEATALYERAAAAKPLDAVECLDVELAQSELAD
jgi:tetratricopeptide (TPR) repeat protein